jgi:hypothetical protein
LGDIEKYIGDVACTMVKIYYIYISKLGVVGKHGRKNIGGHWKGLIFFRGTKGTKKTSSMP